MRALHTFRHKPSTPLIALLAVIAQLWLGMTHCCMAVNVGVCGDGNSARSERLRAQLPPELRLQLPAVSEVANADCDHCSPLCAPALPPPATPTTALPSVQEHRPLAPRDVWATTVDWHTPPARGPPLLS